MSFNQKEMIHAVKKERAEKQQALDALQERTGQHRDMICTFRKSLDALLTTALAYKSQELFNDYHETDEDILSHKVLDDLKERLDEICNYILYQDESYEEIAREEYTEAWGTLWDALNASEALKSSE